MRLFRHFIIKKTITLLLVYQNPLIDGEKLDKFLFQESAEFHSSMVHQPTFKLHKFLFQLRFHKCQCTLWALPKWSEPCIAYATLPQPQECGEQMGSKITYQYWQDLKRIRDCIGIVPNVRFIWFPFLNQSLSQAPR